MAEEEPSDDEKVEFAKAVLALLREHAEELRAKGLPVDDMIRDLEGKLDEASALAKEVRDLQVQDALFTQKREALRREVDEIVRLPPDLADGMATIEYLKEIAEREARRKHGRRGRGG